GFMYLDVATLQAQPASDDPSAGIGDYDLSTWSLSGDGKLLAAYYGAWDAPVRGVILAEIKTGKFTALLTEGPAFGLVFSPDGKKVALRDLDNKVYLWDGVVSQSLLDPKSQVKDWTHVLKTWEGHTNYITTLAFNPAGDVLASGSADKTIRLWDVSQGSTLAILQGHTATVGALAFSPDGSLLATAVDDCTIRLWAVQ